MTGALAVSWLCAAPAFAQDATIALCRAADSEEERLACFEQALRRMGPEVDRRTVDAVAAPAPAPTPAAAPGAPPAIAPEPASSAAPAARAASLGEEQIAPAQRTAPDARLIAHVTDATVVGYQRLQVELENGQVWRQTTAGERWDPALNATPTTVEIWATRFGGYRMRVDDQRQSLHVERVR